MASNTERMPSTLLPTPKSLVRRGGRFPAGRTIGVFVDPSLRRIADVVREELIKLGFDGVEMKGEASSAQLAVLGPGTMPAERERELSGVPFPAQAYSLSVAPEGVTLCALDAKGALHGLATFLQWAEGAGEGGIPAVDIVDYPDIERRIISPTLTWYAGFARIGFGMQLWYGEDWKRFIDWCFRHKISALNIVMYGFWPFEFPEYPETVMRDIKVQTWAPEINDWVEVSFTHPNLKNLFWRT